MYFELLGPITQVETFTVGSRIREIARLRKFIIMMQKPKPAASRFLICVENKGYTVSLEKRKIYVALYDDMAFKHGQVRMIDESGEDYLYLKSFFLTITIPQSLRKAILKAA